MTRSMGCMVLVWLVSCEDTSTRGRRDGTADRGFNDQQIADLSGQPFADGPPREQSIPNEAAVPREASVPLAVNECENMGADWIFCSSFEEGNKEIWDDYDENPDTTNLLMEDPGPHGLTDNHVMRLRAPAGRGGADLVKMLPSQHDKLYARWTIKWEQGYDFNAANHGGGLHAGSRDLLGHSDYRPDGSDWFTAWVEPIPGDRLLNIYSYYRGMYMDCADPQGTCWGDHFPCMEDEGQTYCTKAEHRETVIHPPLQAGQWYCIEVMVDGGTPTTSAAGASGQLNFWVDGLELGPWTDLWLRTTSNLKLNILWLNLFHHADHSVEGVMYDDVVVSTSRIGCR